MYRIFTLRFSVRYFALIFMLTVGNSSFASSDSYCLDDWACVEKTQENLGVTYWLYNKKPYVITVTLKVNTNNLKATNAPGGEHIVTQVLQGQQRIKALALLPISTDQKIWYDDSFHWSPGNMLAVHQPNFVYQYPYAPDKRFPIVQGFGGRYSHSGASKYAVDIAMPVGTAIHAARAGVVIDLVEQYSLGGPNRKYAKYANYVVILHDDQTTGEYYHLKKAGVLVTLGEEVKAGQKIAYSGNTGFSSLPHLHFAVYRAQPFGKYQSLPFRFNSR